mmetsp:Transcript_54015/g.94846  ORF Transcript_54015/g.94846 Transcript_54015/m.94846 type:complete len:238 (-) Transcript_54015:2039-2752(-)
MRTRVLSFPPHSLPGLVRLLATSSQSPLNHPTVRPTSVPLCRGHQQHRRWPCAPAAEARACPVYTARPASVHCGHPHRAQIAPGLQIGRLACPLAKSRAEVVPVPANNPRLLAPLVAPVAHLPAVTLCPQLSQSFSCSCEPSSCEASGFSPSHLPPPDLHVPPRPLPYQRFCEASPFLLHCRPSLPHPASHYRDSCAFQWTPPGDREPLRLPCQVCQACQACQANQQTSWMKQQPSA